MSLPRKIILHAAPFSNAMWEQTWTFALQRAVPEGVITMERGMELIDSMKLFTANLDVWVAVAKMFAAIGRKPA